MVRLINKLSGGEMWVEESRLAEYLAAGHKLAATAPDQEPPVAKPKARNKPAKKG